LETAGPARATRARCVPGGPAAPAAWKPGLGAIWRGAPGARC